MGVVSHQAFTDLSLRYKRVTWQGSFPRAGLCCPRPSSGTATPSATLPARRDFPFQRLYAPPAPGPQAPGAGEGFPSSRTHPLTIPLPLPRRVPQRLHVQVLSAFHGLRREFSGSAPSCPFTGLASRGCRIRLMLRAGQSLPQRGFRRCASTLGVSPQRRQPATGPPGSYPDRTFTGWRTRAYAWASSFLHLLSLPVPHAAGHTNQSSRVAAARSSAVWRLSAPACRDDRPRVHRIDGSRWSGYAQCRAAKARSLAADR